MVLWCLRLLFLLLPVLMSNLTGFGLRQYTYDPFDVVKLFALRVLVTIALGAWAMSFFSSDAKIRRVKHDWLVVAFLGWMVVATILSTHPATSVFGGYARYDGLTTYLGFAALFFLSVQVLTDETRVRSVARMACISGLVVSVYGLVQVVGLDPFKWGTLGFGGHMAFSTLGNPDLMGGYIIFPLVINTVMALSESRRNWKLFHWVASLLIAAAWVATFVRGAWIGGFLGLIIVLVVALRRRQPTTAFDRAFLILAGLAAAAVALISLRSASGVTNFADRLSSIVQFRQGSSLSRLQIWDGALRAIIHRSAHPTPSGSVRPRCYHPFGKRDDLGRRQDDGRPHHL
ncbi:MAG: O-antigen ligase family protein, partial [Actinobacteria bacterium]|nr:O-antigen ligase family protein [Actinomycetota bacterium]